MGWGLGSVTGMQSEGGKGGGGWNGECYAMSRWLRIQLHLPTITQWPGVLYVFSS